jgi:hypothetical protein
MTVATELSSKAKNQSETSLSMPLKKKQLKLSPPNGGPSLLRLSLSIHVTRHIADKNNPLNND